MKIYVAAKYERHDEVREVYRQLKDAGHSVSYDWTYEETNPEPDLLECAQADVEGVREADVLLIYPTEGCKGAWVEFGIAVARRTPIIVVASERQCIFEHLPGVLHVRDTAEALTALRGAEMLSDAVQ